MLKKVIYLHFVPIIAAVVLVYLCLFLFINQNIKRVSVIGGDQEKTRGFHANLIKGDQSELDFISSIKNKKQLTIFGSSEFSTTAFCSFNFLPDSLGLQTMGIGHAYHQNFSILCELLAADEYVENSKICIIISLGWFSTGGTNTKAFLEFVRPNFLKKIISNTNIGFEYKKHIGSYINDHSEEIDGLTKEMDFLRDDFLSHSETKFGLLKKKDQLRQYLKSAANSTVEYKPKLTFTESEKWNGNLNALSKKAQHDFVSKITTNDIYVYDDYYTKYLLDEEGKEKRGSISKVNLSKCNELEDFLLVVKYLKSKNADVSMVIQPLNPYYYSGIDNYNDLVDTLSIILDDNEIPYLNMYIDNKSDYEPGILKDVMHLGDYGWMKINSFLMKLYYES